jgi:hypothetical protein
MGFSCSWGEREGGAPPPLPGRLRNPRTVPVSSPTQRTLQLLRREGYLAAVAEK